MCQRYKSTYECGHILHDHLHCRYSTSKAGGATCHFNNTTTGSRSIIYDFPGCGLWQGEERAREAARQDAINNKKREDDAKAEVNAAYSKQNFA